MTRPLVGVIANSYKIEDRYPMQGAGEFTLESVVKAAGAVPLVFPALPDLADVAELLSVFDGVLLTGARPNVHPSEYGAEPTEAYAPFDQNRDAVALEITRQAVAGGVPLLGVCRGFQEMAVAFGSTLHPEIRDLPGRMNHRMPKDEPNPDVIFRPRHTISLTPGGQLAEILGVEEALVNSLHGQGVLDVGDRVVVEGVAEDGTIEAISIAGAPGFALGAQWHAEYRSAENEVNAKLFAAFGDALRARQARRLGGGLSATAAE
jgi:putative glutamine amidotransferase